MYIVELIYKLKKLKEEKLRNDKNINRDENDTDEEKCSHTFAPLDSTKKFFACTKCGYIIDIKKIKKEKNFFIEK